MLTEAEKISKNPEELLLIETAQEKPPQNNETEINNLPTKEHKVSVIFG